MRRAAVTSTVRSLYRQRLTGPSTQTTTPDGAELLEARLLHLPSVLTVDRGRSAALAVAG
jgi:hypothetical protein